MLYHDSVHRERWIDMADSIWKMGNIWLLKPLYLARVISSKRGDIFRRTTASSFSRLSVDASICYRDIAFVQPWTSGRLAKIYDPSTRTRTPISPLVRFPIYDRLTSPCSNVQNKTGNPSPPCIIFRSTRKMTSDREEYTASDSESLA